MFKSLGACMEGGRVLPEASEDKVKMLRKTFAIYIKIFWF